MINSHSGNYTITDSFHFKSFLITLFLFTGCYITVGWWTDAYQHMFDTAISGELTNYYLPAAHNTFPEYMYGAAFIFNRLGLFYEQRWIAIFLNSILFVSIWVLFFQILRYSSSFPLVSRIVLVAFFSLLFFESIVLYHMVRVTMFAGIAAMSYLLVNDDDRFFNKKAIPYLLLFAVALWIRSNVHLLVLVFVTGVLIIHKKSLKPLLPFWLVFICVFVFDLVVVFNAAAGNDLNSFFLYNTEFKLHFVADYKPDLKLTQPLDTIKYMAIKHDILADETNLGVDFYHRINIFSNLDRFNTAQLQYVVYTFVTAVTQNIYFIVADVVLIVFYVLLGGGLERNYKLKTIGLFFYFYLILFGVCFVKMENRFLVPFQALFLFTIVTLHKPKLFSEKKNVFLLIVFVIAIFPLSLNYILTHIGYSKDQTTEFKNAFELLRKKHSNEVLIYNTGFITYNRPYEVFYQRKYFKKFYVYNYFATQLSPTYRPYLENECKCDVGKFYTLYDYVLNKHGKALIIDDSARVVILNQYLSKVCNRDYDFDRIRDEDFVLRSFKGYNSLFYLQPAKEGP